MNLNDLALLLHRSSKGETPFMVGHYSLLRKYWNTYLCGDVFYEDAWSCDPGYFKESLKSFLDMLSDNEYRKGTTLLWARGQVRREIVAITSLPISKVFVQDNELAFTRPDFFYGEPIDTYRKLVDSFIARINLE